MTPGNSFKWDAMFLFKSPLVEKSIKGTTDIKFEIVQNGSKIISTGFMVSTSEPDKDCALAAILEKANRVLDYLTAKHHVPIRCSLNNWGEVKPPGEVKEREASYKMGSAIFKEGFLNFLSIKPILENNLETKDIQLMRQLSHYRRGLENFVETPTDVITQIREFYMILEDEYTGTSSTILPKYSYIRHFLSHHEMKELDKKGKTLKAYMRALARFRQPYADYSKPELMGKIKEDLPSIKEEAEKIIDRKLK